MMAESFSQKQVLVIEDNCLTMALLRTVLRSEGYEVLEAVTAYPSAGGRLFGIGGMIEGWGFDFGW